MHRARPRAATPSGCDRISSASAGRCARIPMVSPSWLDSSAPAVQPACPGRSCVADPAIDRDRLVADLTALVRLPSVTGSEEAVATWAAEALGDLGLAVETINPDPATVRADPAWPGEEM